MDNEVEEDRERDGPTSSSTTWRTCGSRWRTQKIVPNGEGEAVWLGLPDVLQKEDMSSFLKLCPPSGRHWHKIEKCPAFLIVTHKLVNSIAP